MPYLSTVARWPSWEGGGRRKPIENMGGRVAILGVHPPICQQIDCPIEAPPNLSMKKCHNFTSLASDSAGLGMSQNARVRWIHFFDWNSLTKNKIYTHIENGFLSHFSLPLTAAELLDLMADDGDRFDHGPSATVELTVGQSWPSGRFFAGGDHNHLDGRRGLDSVPMEKRRPKRIELQQWPPLARDCIRLPAQWNTEVGMNQVSPFYLFN